jgi:hypothetical protein
MAKWMPPFHGDYGLSSRYGETGPYWASYHTGTDFVGSGDLNVHPVGKGMVHINEYDDDYGNCVSINHGNGVYTFYAHLQQPCEIPVGAEVTPLNALGLMGETGNVTGAHTHVELRLGTDGYYGDFPIDYRRDIEPYVTGGESRPDPPRNSGAGDPDFYGGTDEVVQATGYTEWFRLEHTVRITLRHDEDIGWYQDIEYLGVTQNSPSLVVGESGSKVAVTSIPIEEYSGSVLDTCLRFFPGSAGQTFHYDRDLQNDIAGPPGGGYIEISPNDWLGPDTNADPAASMCAWSNSRFRSTTAINAPGWPGFCNTLDDPSSGSFALNPGYAGVRFRGERWNPFLTRFGKQQWAWSAAVFDISSNARLDFDGHTWLTDDLPLDAIEQEWDNDDQPVVYESIIWEDATVDRGGSLSVISVEPFKRDDFTSPGWWPTDISAGVPIPPDNASPGMSLPLEGYNRDWDADSNIAGGLCFLPTPVYTGAWLGNYAEMDEDWRVWITDVAFLVKFKTRPYRWLYRLPPIGDPRDVRRRWAIGKE